MVPTVDRGILLKVFCSMLMVGDSGIRSGLDVARMLACGADFVLLGRAFAFAVAAIGPRGPDHAMHVLKAELSHTLEQIGCERLDLLPEFLTRAR